MVFSPSWHGKPARRAQKSPVNMANSCTSLECKTFLGGGSKNVSTHEPFQTPPNPHCKLHGFKNMPWILDHQVICQGSSSSHPTFEKRHQSALADQSRRSHLPVAQSHMATGKSIVNLKVVCKKRDLISTLWFQPKWKLLICQKNKTSPNRSEQKDIAAINLDWWIGFPSVTKCQGRLVHTSNPLSPGGVVIAIWIQCQPTTALLQSAAYRLTCGWHQDLWMPEDA